MAFPSGEIDQGTEGADRLPVVRFTTAGLPAGERFAAWSRTVSALFDRCAPHPRRGGAGFSASLTAYHFGAFLLCHSRADAARYLRSAQRSRLDDLDHYLIHLPLQQAGGFASGSGADDTMRRLRPMDMTIIDLALPSGYVAGAGEAISLIVPRAGLSLLLRDPDRQHGRILRREQPMAAMLAQQLIALNGIAPRFGLHEATALASTVIGLAAVCLGFDTPATARAPPVPSPPAAKESLARRVRAYIEQNLHRETLTPELIVRELAISRSQLYRQFESYGGVRHYVRRRRLRQSLLAICNPLQSGQRIADIAYEKGFSDEAHFSRLFRDAFGLSPREARRAVQRGDAALLAAILPAASSADMGEQAPFAHWIRELAIA
ncbi:MAG: helix-turn-helix domain-containing protein [Ferrovibrio sp.]|uniref:helix-turn-helix domain-containing protein n=1 Tax=Ferrovibrio sp. TaxID=1917215 RepID=UPI00391A93EF